MDPITQVAIGAAVAAAISPREQTRLAAFLGAIAGAAPDLDILIRSEADPLLSLQYHRHFSHALVFAPVIGVLIASIYKLLMFRSETPLKKCVLYATAGALTHGPIDACTSYGTLLYWPFSDQRVSWDLISIIDPVFTLPLVFLTLLAFRWRRPFFARFAVVLCMFYLGFCGFQHFKATETMKDLAARRGHSTHLYSVRPSLGNSLLWRTIYCHSGRYYVNAVWTFPGEKTRVYPGRSVAAFTAGDAAKLADPNSTLGRDIERFRYFSQSYLYRHPTETNVLGDLRYSMYPDSVMPLWGLQADPHNPGVHARLKYFRKFSTASFLRLWKMIRGQEQVEPLDS